MFFLLLNPPFAAHCSPHKWLVSRIALDCKNIPQILRVTIYAALAHSWCDPRRKQCIEHNGVTVFALPGKWHGTHSANICISIRRPPNVSNTGDQVRYRGTDNGTLLMTPEPELVGWLVAVACVIRIIKCVPYRVDPHHPTSTKSRLTMSLGRCGAVH